MLSGLIPSQGYICVAEQLEKGFRHHWCDTPEQADRFVDQLEKAGKTVFIAQATFVSTENRRGENAAFLRNFFLDIDCGKNKPFPDQKAGLLALAGFCTSASLPHPHIINSGNGLYAHWVLDRDIPSGLWVSAAKLLKHLVDKFEPGLDADGICADRARVLRPVGSRNKKDPANWKPVRLVSAGAVQDATGFIRRLKESAGNSGMTLPEPKPAQGLNSAFLLPTDSRPSSALLIARKCAQIDHIQEMRGDVPEPLWYSAIGLLRYTIEAPAIIHEWSQGHELYTPEATDAKIAQHEKANVGPTTCARFAAEQPELCKGCHYAEKVKSPISLGYAAPQPLPQTEESPYPDPPNLFTISGTGVYFNDGGEQRSIYPYPAWVQSINVDHFGESITLRHQLPHDGWKEVTIPSNKVCDPKGFYAAMLDAHIHVIGKDNRGLFLMYIETFMQKLRGEQQMATLSCQMGWRQMGDELAFVHGSEVYRKDGSVSKVGYSVTAPDFVRSMAPQGSTEQWISHTRLLNRAGLEGLAFELLCGAFGAPLVRFSGFEGAMIAVIGGSGLGKTLTGSWGLSAWGDPGKLKLHEDDTKNALVGRLGVYGTLPAYIDEVSNIEPKDLSNMAYKITQGRDKARLTRSAVERSTINRWNTLAIVSSNHSLFEKLISLKGEAGPEINRVFEYEVSAGFTSEEGGQIARTISDNYGAVGRIYAMHLVKTQDQHREALLKISDMIAKKTEALPEERFWVMVGAVAIYGGMLAKKLGLCHIELAPLTEWIIDTIKSMRCFRQDASFDAVHFVGTLLSKHVDHIIAVNHYDPKNDKFSQPEYRTPKGLLVGRIELDRMRLWIAHDTLKEALHKQNMSLRKLAYHMRDKGLVASSQRLSLARGTIYGGIVQTCWELDLTHPALGYRTMGVVRALKEREESHYGLPTTG